MKFILGKKIEMTQLFDEQGEVMPVTQVEAGPCIVSQVKSVDKDGYQAVQVGFGKKKKISKAVRGHLNGLGDFRWLREFKIQNSINRTQEREELKLKRGDKITVDTFKVGDKVMVTGISKGKGFQGVVKRHGFSGSPASHGHKDQLRASGSIGASEPARVFKGRRMAGHMGRERVSVKNLEIAKIDSDKNILYIKGAVPGARGSLVMISGEGELKVNTEIKKSKNQEIKKQEKENVGTQVIASQEEKK